MSTQRDLFGAAPQAPDGLVYRPELVTAAEERALLGRLAERYDPGLIVIACVRWRPWPVLAGVGHSDHPAGVERRR